MKAFNKCTVLILTVVILLLCVAPASSAVSGGISQDIIAESSKVAVEIEQEGFVLLKNEDNVLPLTGKKVNVFGAGSVTPFLGGASGSGVIVTLDPVDFYEALDKSSVEYNPELREFYENNKGNNDIPKSQNPVLNNLVQLILSKNTIDEVKTCKISDELMNNAVAFSDTALIVISRTSAEETDLTPENLRITDDERALIEKVNGAFENVIIIFNTGNVMEMDWLEDYENIKAAAMMWIPGEFGMEAVGQILSGEVNPSGRLADTIAYSLDDYPTTENFGDFEYNRGGEKFVEYQEGIYVGYRYFETFAKDKVQFPFGHGLSYTSFRKEITSYNTSGDEITVSVKVTNTGSVSGKDTAQIYYSAPYTQGGIEKSAICLAGYQKTDILAPGESEVVTVKFDKNDMASYDMHNLEAWVLEKGNYKIILGENVREHIDSFTYTVNNDVVIKNDSVTGAEIKNLFDFAYNGFTVLSRADFEGTYPEARKLDATDDVKNADKQPEKTTEGTVPKMGVEYEEGVITLRDVYEDMSLLDKFLDQLTLDEMANLVTHSGYQTYGIERLGIPKTYDNDGPSCVKGRYGITFTDSGTSYPCATAIACTWNEDLAHKMGTVAAIEAKDIGTDIWYAPAANIHRNPLGGRNYEYFSEDPLIAGRMCSQIINAAYDEGIITTIKHFVLNEQETNRTGAFTWIDEQALREIYLKAFEFPIKNAEYVGVMSAYNRIGADWCGACSELLIDLLRKEWGFDGYVISDYSNNFVGPGYMDPVLAVYNGNDTILTGVWMLNMPSHLITVKLAYHKDPIGFGNALREACKHICLAKMQTRPFLEPDYVSNATTDLTEEYKTNWPEDIKDYPSHLFYWLVNSIIEVVRLII